MTITATELKTNLHKYLVLSQSEDVYVTSNGKIVTKLSNPYSDRVEKVKKLFGRLPGNVTLKEALDDRAKKI